MAIKKFYSTKAKAVRYFPLILTVQKILAEASAIQSGEFIFSQNGTLTGTYYVPNKAADSVWTQKKSASR